MSNSSSTLGHVSNRLSAFLQVEYSAGLVLVVATVAAMLIKNSWFSELYLQFLNLEGQVRLGSVDVTKPLFLWVNDLWMAIFFFVVGLEIKNEWLFGYLKDRRQIVLPALGAVGVFCTCYAAISLGFASLPSGTSWTQLFGVSVLCGIGFTMSFFIGGLAFAEDGVGYARIDRLAIILASLASAAIGFLILRFSSADSGHPDA